MNALHFQKKAFWNISKDLYLKNTFTKEDIFHKKQIEIFEDKLEYEISEIKTFILGRCYIVKRKTRVTLFDFSTMIIFKRDFDLQIYVHNPGKNMQAFF